MMEKEIISRAIGLKACSTSAKAEALWELIKETGCLEEECFKNIWGYGSDGANAMRGNWNSILSRLKELRKDAPLWIIWCLCHIFHLIIKYSQMELPKFENNLDSTLYKNLTRQRY